MKQTGVIISLAFFLLPALNCAGQQSTQPSQTIHVQKESVTNPKDIGLRIFELYCKEEFDTLIIEYFPTQEIFISLCKQENIATDDDVFKTAQNDFNKIQDTFMSRLIEGIEEAKAHNAQLNNLTIDSISLDYHENETKSNTDRKFLSIIIHCSDKNKSYRFLINPLFGYLDKWYLFETRLGFRQKHD